MLAVWLDGRNTKGAEGHEAGHGHGHGGAMTLRSVEFDEEGNLYEEAELDSRVCDCCQTDVALTDNGPVVVYRDRSEEEIRDMAIVRKVNGQWTAPQQVYEDQWKITGCPVNGPAIAAQNNTVAIAWFSAPENQNRVQLTFSNDGGATFSKPIRIDDGNPIGRVDVVLVNPTTALVSWIEQVGETGEVRMSMTNLTDGKMGTSIIATSIGIARQNGFPILEKMGEGYLLAWTAGDSITRVKTLAVE